MLLLGAVAQKDYIKDFLTCPAATHVNLLNILKKKNCKKISGLEKNAVCIGKGPGKVICQLN